LTLLIILFFWFQYFSIAYLTLAFGFGLHPFYSFAMLLFYMWVYIDGSVKYVTTALIL